MYGFLTNNLGYWASPLSFRQSLLLLLSGGEGYGNDLGWRQHREMVKDREAWCAAVPT